MHQHGSSQVLRRRKLRGIFQLLPGRSEQYLCVRRDKIWQSSPPKLLGVLCVLSINERTSFLYQLFVARLIMNEVLAVSLSLDARMESRRRKNVHTVSCESNQPFPRSQTQRHMRGVFRFHMMYPASNPAIVPGGKE